VTCSATDAAGLTAVGTFSVVVSNGPPDTTAPVITVPGTLTLEASSPTGRTVTYTASATDAIDGNVAVACSPASNTTFPLASTTVTCTARDTAGNSGSKTFSVVVRPAAANLAVIRTTIDINGGSAIEGAVAVTSAGRVTLNAGRITGDLKVPGAPQMQINSGTFTGYVDGTGSQAGTPYTITLNSGSTLARIVRYTDGPSLATVAAAPAPTGSVSISANSSSEVPTSLANVRDLTLNNSIGDVAVPAGAYGRFTANNANAFVLGTPGATIPSAYSFTTLNLNSTSALKIVGPVIITITDGLSTSSNIGASLHPEWTRLRIASGSLVLNGGITAAIVEAPAGNVTLNGGAKLTGGVAANSLILNSGTLTIVSNP
jgi:hypothetical protein